VEFTRSFPSSKIPSKVKLVGAKNLLSIGKLLTVVGRVIFWVAFVALVVTAGSSAEGSSDFHFPEQRMELFLTDQPAADLPGFVLDVDQAGASAASAFVVPGTSLPIAVPLIGQQSERWTARQAAIFDMSVITDAKVVLYFALDAEVLSSLTVRLLAVSQNGSSHLLAEAQRQFVTALASEPQEFLLPSSFKVQPAGTMLQLQVEAAPSSGLVLLQYNSASAPSRIFLAVQVADHDGDGIPDSVDPCPSVRDCDGNGIPDGDQHPGGGNVGSNGTAPGNVTYGPRGPTYYQFYFYGEIPSNPPPGAPGHQSPGDTDGHPRRGQLQLYSTSAFVGMAGSTGLFLLLRRRL
jgi:hypothetical protein